VTINIFIYARQSADCPVSAQEQASHLRTIATDNGWMVAKVFIDQPPTTNKGRDRRPGQMALLEAIRVGSVERVLLYSIDRVARTLAELVNFIETCRSCGIGLYLHEQHLDTAASNGISLFDLAGMMALHVRQSRRERILRGQAAARAASVRFGRPRISSAKREKARQGLASGKRVRQVARLAGISAASVSRIKSESVSCISS
jgi:DNA invertase Pin-like site-specific DNA recombinase